MNLKVLSTDKEIKNLGVVSSEEEADVLCARARERISTYGSQQVLDFGRTDMQELVQEISVEHTRKILGGNIGMVFCGSQNEGFTMIPVVEDFVTRFHLKDLFWGIIVFYFPKYRTSRFIVTAQLLSNLQINSSRWEMMPTRRLLSPAINLLLLAIFLLILYLWASKKTIIEIQLVYETNNANKDTGSRDNTQSHKYGIYGFYGKY
ncbi:hypothetical protein JQM83_12895 [Parabacteroides distasonis]|nr:hypothetical protein [Parabacteroides distasonis]